ELSRLLSRAIELVRDDHGPGCDLSHPGTHAASIAMLRERGRMLGYLVLSDVTLVLDRISGLDVITDERFALAVAQNRARALARGSKPGSTEHAERGRRAAVEKQKLTRRDGGYRIAAAEPAAAQHAIASTVQLEGANGVRRAALMTEGT